MMAIMLTYDSCSMVNRDMQLHLHMRGLEPRFEVCWEGCRDGDYRVTAHNGGLGDDIMAIFWYWGNIHKDQFPKTLRDTIGCFLTAG